MRIEDINDITSETGIIATLIRHPEFSFYSEELLPNHFSNRQNACIYLALTILARENIRQADAFNIISALHSSDATKRYADELDVDELQDFIDISQSVARDTIEEYKLLVGNVMDMSFRRDTFRELRECERMCLDTNTHELEQKIYSTLDDVMMNYTSTTEVPPFSEVVDKCWDEIRERQNSEGCSGYLFKFPALNQYATIERGELFIFAAEAKQGKSMMLLNCAVDLLRQDFAVLYLDSELNTRMFTARVLAYLSGVEYKRLTSGRYTEEEAERIDAARAWLKTRKFTHVYIPMFDQQTIYTTIKKVSHTQGLDVLIVDYFKSLSDGDAFNSYQELGRLTDFIKNQIAGEMNIAALGAAQLTATGKVADSAKIGRNASTIAIITDKTPDEIAEDGAECGNKKLRVILNRNGMQMSQDEYIDLQFNGNLISYEQAQQYIPHVPY